MCLTLKWYHWPFTRTTRKDITSYKILCKRDLTSLYNLFPYELGKLYRADIVKDKKEVDKGFHSYKHLKEAKGDTDHTPTATHERWRTVVVECTIPAGSKYYRGIWASDTENPKNYVSNQIIINKIL